MTVQPGKKIMANASFPRDLQYAKFSAYGFLKNLRFFEPFMVLFLLEQGLSFVQVGSLYALREIAVNLLEVPTGTIADGLGRRRTMVAAFTAYLLSFGLFWTGSGMPVFVVAMLVFSFGDAFRTGTHKAMIFAYLRLRGLERHAHDYYGHTRGWSQTGSALSALLAATIVFVSSEYRTVFLFSMLPYAADLVLMLTYPKELNGTTGTITFPALAQSFEKLWRGLREAVGRPGAARAVFSAAAYAGYFKGSKDYLQAMIATLAATLPLGLGLTGRRREAILLGAIYTLIYVFNAAASRGSAGVAHRLGGADRALNRELLLGLLLGAAAGATRWLGFTVLPVVLFLLLFLLHNLRKPLGVSAVAERVPEDVLATVLSAESQFESLFAALTAFLIGVAADALSGNVGPGIVIVAAVGLALFPLLRLTPSRRPPATG